MAVSQASLRLPSEHVHVAGEVCPYCDQPIPNDRAEEIHARFKAKEQEQAEALKTQLNEQLARAREDIQSTANLAIEKAQRESAAAVEQLRAEAATQQNAAREEGKKAAEDAAREQIASLTQTNEALKAATQEQVAEAQRQKAEALGQLEALKSSHEASMQQRALEVREAMEKDKLDAVNALKAEHFESTQKLNTLVQTLQRRLEEKNAAELGEGAEVKLFEALKAAFPDDRITRVGKGTAGADIMHVVIHNGKECGKIVYDSKDRNAWRDDYVTKLRADKAAAKAEHAILATRKFPAKTDQLKNIDGVIVANPARVVVLVELVRGYVVQTHSLRISGKEREAKTVALYSYITCDHFNQQLDSFGSQMEKVLDLDADEQKAHARVWEKRGRLVKSAQKIHGDLRADIERIIGTGHTE